MNAPSAHNKRPWNFIVIRNKETLNHLAEIKEYAKMLKEANIAIAMVGTKTTDYWHLDMAASTQNILLAATNLNIGSCWIGINPQKEETKKIEEVLNIPEDKHLFALVALGYNDEKPEPNDYFVEYLIHYEKWQY